MKRLIVPLLSVCMGVPTVLTQSTQTPSTAAQSVDSEAAVTLEQAAKDDRPAFHLTVDLVQIDVRVTDRSGKPLIGLKPEQFTVLEDGKVQKINSFDFYDIEKIEQAGAGAPPITVRLGSVPPAEALAHSVLDHRFIVLFFDLTAQCSRMIYYGRNAERNSTCVNRYPRPTWSQLLPMETS